MVKVDELSRRVFEQRLQQVFSLDRFLSRVRCLCEGTVRRPRRGTKTTAACPTGRTCTTINNRAPTRSCHPYHTTWQRRTAQRMTEHWGLHRLLLAFYTIRSQADLRPGRLRCGKRALDANMCACSPNPVVLPCAV